jgi:PKD repeat protein
MQARKRVPFCFCVAVLLLTALAALFNSEPGPQAGAAAPHTIFMPRSPEITVAQHVSVTATPKSEAGFTRNCEGLFKIQRPAYSASVSPLGRLCYEPTGQAGERLQLQLRSVYRGEQSLYSKGRPGERAAANGTDHGGVGLQRSDDLTESFMPRFDGVEQSFTLARVPDGDGGLEFICDVAANGLSAQTPRADRAGGVSFCDASGRCAVRYGQIVIRDAAGRGMAAEPEYDVAARTIRFAVPASWLRDAAFPIVVDPLVGGDFVVSPDNSNGVAPPAIAAGNNNYIIAWDDFTLRTTAPTLLAAIVSPTGIVSNPIQLSSNVAAPRPYHYQRTEAAFDGANWLVVWAEDGGTGAEIHGALVSSGTGSLTSPQPGGGTIIGGSDFKIASTTGTIEEDPLVAFNGVDYVVAWHSGPVGTPSVSSGVPGGAAAGPSQIFYTRVTSTGTVATVTPVASLFAKPNQSLYFLAGQKPSGDTLMVYREGNETPASTRAARIAPDGTLRDPGGISLFRELQKDNGFGRPIGAAFIGSDWQVLSSYDETLDSAIFMHHVSTAGTVTAPTGVFAVMGLGPTGTTSDPFQPAFAGSTSWLFLRNEKVSTTAYHILGKRVAFDGTDQDPIPIQVDTAMQGILRNGVAAQSGNQFLVSWLDGRRGTPPPGDARNIAAAFVDSVLADTPGPGLVPVIAASPTSGAKPLAVSFDGSQSTGTFDSLQWSFGDGTSSTSSTVSHTYVNNGTYTAQLKLIKGAYQVTRTVTIFVGVSGFSEPTQIGVPVQSTDGIVPNFFISKMQFGLDFATSQNDGLLLSGTVDPEFVPAVPTGTTCSVKIGSVAHQFAVDSKGSFTSDATQKTSIKFSVKPSSGVFSCQINKDDLRAELDSLGAHNTTVNPPLLVTVPVTIAVNSLTATASVGLEYKATLNQKGIGTYAFQKTGTPVSGAFVISAFSATEQSSASHNYAIKGQLTLPNGGSFSPLASGNFVIQLGTYAQTLSTAQLSVSGSSIKFAAPKGTTTGLKSFTLNTKTGVFALQFLALPSGGDNGTGLPLSTGNDIANVDLNLSFQFDLSNQHIDAGRYIYIARNNASAKSWKLRDFQ